jgi:hypothetical protein
MNRFLGMEIISLLVMGVPLNWGFVNLILMFISFILMIWNRILMLMLYIYMIGVLKVLL